MKKIRNWIWNTFKIEVSFKIQENWFVIVIDLKVRIWKIYFGGTDGGLKNMIHCKNFKVLAN